MRGRISEQIARSVSLTQDGMLRRHRIAASGRFEFSHSPVLPSRAAAVPNTSTGSAPATPRGVEDGTVASASQKPLRSAGPASQSGELDPVRVTVVGKPIVRESRPAPVVCSRRRPRRLSSVLARPAGRPRCAQLSPSCLTPVTDAKANPRSGVRVVVARGLKRSSLRFNILVSRSPSWPQFSYQLSASGRWFHAIRQVPTSCLSD